MSCVARKRFQRRRFVTETVTVMKFELEEIKAIPILQVAERLGIQVIRGKTALCFSGHDTKPSLGFMLKKNSWHCFGCLKGGSVIDLVMGVLSLDFTEAAQWLSEQFSVGLQLIPRKRKPKISRPKVKSSGKCDGFTADVEVNEALLGLCKRIKSVEGIEYLKKHAISPAVAFDAGLRETITPWKLEAALLARFSQARLLKSRVMTERRNLVCLRWWDHTILIPCIVNNRPEYIQGRRIKEDDKPKYLNVGAPRPPMFNSDILRKLKPQTKLYICEGAPDCLALLSAGYNAVGILGASSFRPEFVEPMLPFNIFIVPDGDAGGKAFAEKVRESFLTKGKAVTSLEPVPGKDISELFAERMKTRTSRRRSGG